MNTPPPTDDDPPTNLHENETILKFISDILMEEEDELENESLTSLHDILALQATEKSLYDALTNNTNNNIDLHQNNSHVSESEPPLEMYDDYLLRSEWSKNKPSMNKPSKKYRSRGCRIKDMKTKELVDLRSLLFNCAQAVSDFDSTAVTNLIVRIRDHSSPHGDDVERVAHYFTNALEARLSGNSTAQPSPYKYNYMSEPVSDILKACKMFITACPFMTMANLFVKQTLLKLISGRSTALHIVDFGVTFGFEWPCLILALSERPGGPPKLRITGIDLPQPGFRPAQKKVTDTGRRLARYCERFGVPFEYNALVQKWDTIRPEDIKVEKGEVLVVNCLNQLHCVMDEAGEAESPRDEVLKLIKKMNPDMFVHGIVNASHSTPYFVARFRLAFFYYLAIFDMFEATVAREEDEDQRMRVGFEKHLLGKGVMNIVACEGDERIERPEGYKQWEFRTRRAGFRTLPIDGEILKCVGKVKKDYNYHEDFSVDKDGEWMVFGWKGRIINAISCWH